MSNIDKLASELKSLIQESDSRKPQPYDTDADVVRVEGDTLWVHIPGGVEETPIKKTINAIPGDRIKVHIANGQAWISGNETAPPTDDRQANYALDIAYDAAGTAQSAIDNAKKAKEAADKAELEAERAKETADAVEEIATNAQQSADNAYESAESAKASADTAIRQLSIVEDVVGVLDLISKKGQYELTQNTEVVPDKWYFTREGEGTAQSPYVYSVVSNPQGNPSEEGWYELTGVDEAIRNYVSSHLVIDDNGLWLQKDGVNSRLQLHPSEGLLIHGSNGKVIGKYGKSAQIGDSDGFHIKIGIWYEKTKDLDIVQDKDYYVLVDDAYILVENPVVSDLFKYYEQKKPELGFYEGTNKVAYITNQQLYITQSVVLQQMDLGTPVNKGGLGQWSWKVHANHETPPRNNLNLKWIG